MKKKFTAPFERMAEFGDIKKKIYAKKGVVDLDGCMDSEKLHLVYALPEGFINEKRGIRLVVTYDEIRAAQILSDYRLFDERCALYPAKDLIFYQADIKGNLLTGQRIEALRLITEGGATLVTTIDALMERTPPMDRLGERVVRIKKDSPLPGNGDFAGLLVRLGYEKVARVEDGGQFAVRGGILDVFSMTEDNPCRIELWGDDVTSIRSFDCESQRSIEELEEACIYPAGELILTQEEKLAGLLRIEKEAAEASGKLREAFHTEEAARIDRTVRELRENITLDMEPVLDAYLPYFFDGEHSLLEALDPGNTTVFIDEPARVMEKGEAVLNEFKESMLVRASKGYALGGQSRVIYPVEKVFSSLSAYPCCSMSVLQKKQSLYKSAGIYSMNSKSVNSYNKSFTELVKDLKRYRKNRFSVMLISPSHSRARRLAQDLTEEGATAFYSEDDDRVINPGEIMVCCGNLSRGFEYPLFGFALICESDIFGTVKKKKRRKKNFSGMSAQGFSELSVGDYVVHENHGLGIYQGIEHIEVDSVVRDYMKISYRDGGNLYIPATEFEAIQKYASADAKKPKLNKLGGNEWSRTRSRVKEAVEVVAKDLVELYRKRLSDTGYIYDEDTVWQKEFEEMFPYEETEDQLEAINDIKKDMMSPKIMDRLICGDVGFGKTEVALRAAFKAALEGKQVAFLVPTTILASQHYNNFVQRLKDFPMRVDMLSRFRTTAQQKKTVEDLKKGLVDIVVGTHRLLSKDVAFKDLGLLVIDEEQRFGVAHKEKIKKLRENVDVLALSATPIPRTLHMSLAGIRDMSLLEEPPEERMPIQTFVMEYNEEMVREAISRELSRGGQVYYVYNRSQTIADVCARISSLVPEARIEYAHGKMSETRLEELMSDFISGDIDVLVSTTIIETGLDIPNVNTIIVHDSDRMGLSQLYQLRGRVGRSSRVAYAFLMYRRDKLLREEAEKRLSAIREFTDLGSGFRIAMKDLEIRGAGNVLGKSQHGHMEAVGYELYCKLLNEAVRKEKGESPGFDWTSQVDININAFIPSSYISNESMKLDMYKRISVLEDEGEAEDIEAELGDRFGHVPESVKNLIKVSLLRVGAQRAYIRELKVKKGKADMFLYDKAPIDPAHIMELLDKYAGRLSFAGGGAPKLTFVLKNEEFKDIYEELTVLLADLKEA